MKEAGCGEAKIRARLPFEPVRESAEAHMILGDTYVHWAEVKFIVPSVASTSSRRIPKGNELFTQ